MRFSVLSKFDHFLTFPYIYIYCVSHKTIGVFSLFIVNFVLHDFDAIENDLNGLKTVSFLWFTFVFKTLKNLKSCLMLFYVILCYVCYVIHLFFNLMWCEIALCIKI